MKQLSLFFWLYCLITVSSDFSDSRTSSNSKDTSDLSVKSSEGCPAHKFLYENKTIQSGKAKGKKKWTVILEIGPYLFKRKVDRKVGSR